MFDDDKHLLIRSELSQWVPLTVDRLATCVILALAEPFSDFQSEMKRFDLSGYLPATFR